MRDFGSAGLIVQVAPQGVAAAELHDLGQEVLLHPSEMALVAQAHESRKRDFALGRASAHAALAELGAGRELLLRAPDGAVMWPPGFCGAITHTRGYAAALAAPAGQFRGLGVDAERIGGVTPDLYPRLFSPAEIAGLTGLADSQRDIAATLLFSAKESAFKAISAASGTRPGLAILQVTLMEGEFRVQTPDGQAMTGRYLVESDLAITALALV